MDMAFLGDMNLDWLMWSATDYQLGNLVDLVKIFLADSALQIF